MIWIQIKKSINKGSLGSPPKPVGIKNSDFKTSTDEVLFLYKDYYLVVLSLVERGIVADKNYLTDFPEECVLAQVLKRHPDGEQYVCIRSVTNRELSLRKKIEEIGICVGDIFSKEISTHPMLENIEQSVGDLLEKVKKYSEGA